MGDIMKLVSGELMSEIDKYTINKIGIPGAVLMENAGRGVYEKFIEEFLPEKSSSILIVCGKGNNGGDGFVVARYLYNNDFKNIKLILLTESGNLKGDAEINCKICQNMGLKISEVSDFEKFDNLVRNNDFDYIFDAILGTGLKKEVRDFYRKIIEYINNSNAKTVSIDIPSGLHAERGIQLGVAVKAELTCTFGYKKTGLATYPGAKFTGKVKVIDISIPENIPFEINCYETDENIVKNIYKTREKDLHKGSFGHVVVLGGSVGFTGAAVLSAKAALMSGCGLVTSIVPSRINNTVEKLFIEGMTYPVDFNTCDRNELLLFINSKNALVIGPGFGKSEEVKQFLFEILPKIETPVVIDADGLNIISENLTLLKAIKHQPVLTPHPGEMSRLTGISVKDIQNNRIEVAKKFAQDYNAIVVLKGYKTIITDGKTVYINPTGSSALASGGSGDVLSGMIASFIAQKYEKLDAAVLAAYTHGFAGEIAANKKSEESVIATDILDNLHYPFKIYAGEIN
jgi:NAD(P)H-hydrate epimerase